MIKKLRWKIFAHLLVLSIFIIGILILFQNVLLRETYQFIRKRELNNSIVYIENRLKTDIKNIDDTKNFQKLKDYVQYKYDVLIKKSDEYTKPKHNPFDNKTLREIEEKRDFILSSGEKISITFYAILTPVESTVSTLQTQLVIVAFIIILFSLILASIISKKISKPIENINNSAKELSKGNFDIKFYSDEYLEIEELSKTLNKATYDLSQVDNLRRELLANVSHDLRTPLTLIYGNTEIMLDFPEEITRENILTIKNECENLTNLVNDMLDISKIESGNIKLNKERYSITESIKQSINRFKNFEKNCEITFEFKEDVEIYADKIKINQVIYNLISNAINYSNENCKIKIIQSIENNFIKIEIIDNGIGIKKEDLENIWTRYYKTNKKHKRAKVGTGLGLSIVEKIVKLHNGNCGVKSEYKKGSNFYFSLPL